jgi:Family of unknown function (DUF6194)
VDQDAIIQYITDTFWGVEVVRGTDGPGAGDTFFFYDPQRNIDPTRRLPFATIVTKDYGDFDNLSQLNRPGVFRLNLGLSRETFRTLFDSPSIEYDFAALDRLMPHPVYAAQSWACVLNPSLQTFGSIKPLLAEAYTIVKNRHDRRVTQH